jgi:hypothetical protein
MKQSEKAPFFSKRKVGFFILDKGINLLAYPINTSIKA